MALFKDLVQNELKKLIKERCEGCQHNHPSQLKHFYCFYDWEEDKEQLLNQAIVNIKGQPTKTYTFAEFLLDDGII